MEKGLSLSTVRLTPDPRESWITPRAGPAASRGWLDALDAGLQRRGMFTWGSDRIFRRVSTNCQGLLANFMYIL